VAKCATQALRVTTQSVLFGGPLDLDLPDSDIRYWPDWLTPEKHLMYWQALQSLAWEQSRIRIAGRWLDIPRLNAWYGDESAHYGYSGVRLAVRPWTEELTNLRAAIQAVTGVEFNSVLANYYRDGNDSVDWHADDEKELGQDPIIASLSLGATRTFCLKHRYDKTLKAINIDLLPGSLLLMAGGTQKNWLHRIPKTKKPVAGRINLTFRRVFAD